MLAEARVIAEVAEEERLRAHVYQLLARFLASPPDAALLELAAGFEGDETELGQALARLAALAAQTTPKAAEREYFELFIGVGRGELLPYASYYLTGFLQERPLAKLRVDMMRLGIGRAANVREPEDHIAALCEMMAGLITGAFDAPRGLDVERAFFETHLAPWAKRFFEDLEAAKAARLYMPVGTLGRVFMSIEQPAFRMEA